MLTSITTFRNCPRTARAICAALAAFALTWAGLGSALADDKVFLKSGQEIDALVLGLEGKELKLRRRLPEGLVSMNVPVDNIERITLEPNKAQKEALEKTSPGAIGELEVLWLRHEQFLDLFETDPVPVALALARELRAKQDRPSALRIVSLVEKLLPKVEGNPSREIALLRYQALAYDELDRPNDAVAVADRIQEIAADLPDSDRAEIETIQVQAAMSRADASLTQLRQLEKDWPKWHLMPEKRLERQKFVDATLNAYLEPVVFFPHNKERCAEGLFHAAELYRSISQPEEAELRLQEILDRYPVDAFKARATTLLAEIKADPDATSSSGETES